MPRSKKFDPDMIANFCRRKGVTWQDAAIHFGCSRSTIVNACKVHGIVLEGGHASEVARLRRVGIADWVRNNNATAKEACEHFGIGYEKLRIACKENGVRVASSRSVDFVAVSSFEIVALLIQGRTCVEVAKEMCISEQRVRQIKLKAIKAELLGPNAIIQLKPEFQDGE